eukprot:3940702-Rhodomonas_salina.4
MQASHIKTLHTITSRPNQSQKTTFPVQTARKSRCVVFDFAFTVAAHCRTVASRAVWHCHTATCKRTERARGRRCPVLRERLKWYQPAADREPVAPNGLGGTRTAYAPSQTLTQTHTDTDTQTHTRIRLRPYCRALCYAHLACCAMRGTGTAGYAMLLRACYAMSGTELGCGATRYDRIFLHLTGKQIDAACEVCVELGDLELALLISQVPHVPKCTSCPEMYLLSRNVPHVPYWTSCLVL